MRLWNSFKSSILAGFLWHWPHVFLAGKKGVTSLLLDGGRSPGSSLGPQHYCWAGVRVSALHQASSNSSLPGRGWSTELLLPLLLPLLTLGMGGWLLYLWAVVKVPTLHWVFSDINSEIKRGHLITAMWGWNSRIPTLSLLTVFGCLVTCQWGWQSLLCTWLSLTPHQQGGVGGVGAFLSFPVSLCSMGGDRAMVCSLVLNWSQMIVM